MKEIQDKIINYTKELRLPTLRKIYLTKAEQAAQDQSSYEQYLLTLLEEEYLLRLPLSTKN